MKFVKATGTYTSRYDARAGLLHVGAQDNGEGWWNWWIALAPQGPAPGDYAIVESGGSKSLKAAKEEIVAKCKEIAGQILDDAE